MGARKDSRTSYTCNILFAFSFVFLMLETYWQAILLGVVQGLTEFLPVSSSGHLAMTQQVLKLDPESSGLLLFDVATHVATLAAVGVVFFGSLRRYVVRLAGDLRPSGSNRPWLMRAVAVRIALLGVAASVPTAAIGLVFKDQIEHAFGEPIYIGVGLLITGTLLLITSRRTSARMGWRQFTFAAAVVVGVAQGLAIMPGISRSGATICAAMLLGLRRRWAAEFSFFIAAPAILGATALKMRDMAELPADALSGLPIGPILVGCVAAFVVGIAALALLLHAVRRVRLTPFAVYCYAAGLAILVAASTGCFNDASLFAFLIPCAGATSRTRSLALAARRFSSVGPLAGRRVNPVRDRPVRWWLGS